MAETTDDSKTFPIALTGEEPEPDTKVPWAALGAGAVGLYFLLRK